MIVIPGPIPLIIHPFFWLTAALIGWLNSRSLIGTFIWMGIILVSVVVHEYGHALTAKFFKQKVRIQLIAMGGVTSFEGPKLKYWKQFLITLNGPIFGFLLFLGATVLLRYEWSLLFTKILILTQMANLIWTVINLIPVIPLDGGQLLRITLEGFFGVAGFRASLLIGAILSLLIALAFFMMQALLIGVFMFFFAFQNFDMWRKSRYVTLDDRDDDLKKDLLEAEMALQRGDKHEAKQILEKVRSNGAHGILAFTAMQYLAFLAMEEGKTEEAYELLIPIRQHLSNDGLCLLHKLAAIHKNDSLVTSLSQECYQIAPTQEMALENARAFARLNNAKAAGGWLQTANQFGGLDLDKILQEEEFQKVKNHPDFKEFI
jgi:Zn-dependent protease